MCDHKETSIGETVVNNFVGFKKKINQFIAACRTRILLAKVPIDA